MLHKKPHSEYLLFLVAHSFENFFAYTHFVMNILSGITHAFLLDIITTE